MKADIDSCDDYVGDDVDGALHTLSTFFILSPCLGQFSRQGGHHPYRPTVRNISLLLCIQYTPVTHNMLLVHEVC